MQFTEGDNVLVWHSDLKEYMKGKVLGTKGGKYKVRIRNGGEMVASEMDMRSDRPSRISTRKSMRIMNKSPSRMGYKTDPVGRSPSRRTGKSPRRTAGRSLGRSPIRSPIRSPVRSLAKSLARSPTRPTKSHAKLRAETPPSSPDRSSGTSSVNRKDLHNARLAKVSLPRIDVSAEKFVEEKKATVVLEPIVDLNAETVPHMSRLRDSVVSPRRSIRSSASTSRADSEHTSILLPRSIDRAVSLPVERKNLLQDSSPEGKERGLSAQRYHDLKKTTGFDADAKPESTTGEKWKKEIHMVNQPQEWGGRSGTLLLLLLLPACLILPQLMCTKAQCKFVLTNSTISTRVKDYISADATMAYAGFLTVLAVVSAIPIGRNVEGQYSKTGTLKYRINGFLCTLVCLIAYGLSEYKGIPVTRFILDNVVQLSITGWLLGTILALLLHVKAIKGPVANLNIHASTNSAIYNFWQGKEINPRIGRVDLKLILIRASAIGTLIINTAVLTRAVSTMGLSNLKFAVYLIAPLQLFCTLDFLVFESAILTSFKVMYEGTGYMTCVGHLLYPFLATLATRFALYQKTPISYVSGIFVLCFVIGYTLYRRSNSQKNAFRRNPLIPGLGYLKTIPTSRGKRLMSYGLWGYVRHPNYLGDIFMQWSISLITLASDILPYYAALCCTLILLHRAIRDEGRCKTRYGSAWDLYCSRVKYRILRRVF